jgi:2-iminobutanoate/2-iminopropanoate deaminase
MHRPLRRLALLLPLALLSTGCITTVTRTAAAPAPSGPHREAFNSSTLFSAVVRTGNLYFLSGVIGAQQGGENGIEPETRRVLETIQSRLATVGATMEDLVKCTVFLIDIADYQAMNGVYSSFFPVSPPARTAIAVRALPGNATVEIECIAAAR